MQALCTGLESTSLAKKMKMLRQTMLVKLLIGGRYYVHDFALGCTVIFACTAAAGVKLQGQGLGAGAAMG